MWHTIETFELDLSVRTYKIVAMLLNSKLITSKEFISKGPWVKKTETTCSI